MMRDALLFGSGNLVGADVEAAIHRGRIAADDLAVVVPRERDGERALPDCGRTEHRDQRRTPAPGAPCARANARATSTASAMSRPSCCARVGAVTGGTRTTAGACGGLRGLPG